MLDKFLFNLQLFADGGDGGDGGEATDEGGEMGEELARIPNRARKAYKEAVEKTKPKAESTKAEESTEPKKLSYMDLIKSDDYKEEHQAYMDKTIKDRFKKYDGMEERNKKMAGILDSIALKYNLDTKSDSYLDELEKAVNSDDSYIEDFAMEKGISNDEARSQITLQRKLDSYEEEKRLREAEERKNARTQRLFMGAEKCKQMYPSFDLDTEMQNEKFVKICMATNEDVLAAYEACHHDEIMKAYGQKATIVANQQISNSVANNQKRPLENGIQGSASAIVTKDYTRMNLQQIREEAARMRQEKYGK